MDREMYLRDDEAWLPAFKKLEASIGPAFRAVLNEANTDDVSQSDLLCASMETLVLLLTCAMKAILVEKDRAKAAKHFGKQIGKIAHDYLLYEDKEMVN